MSADAHELVRQLTENPEVLDRMQHMISLLRTNPSQHNRSNTGGVRSNLDAPGSEDSTQQTVRPPRTGLGADGPYSRHELAHTGKLRSYDIAGRTASPPSASGWTEEALFPQTTDRSGARRAASDHNPAVCSASSPMPTFSTAGDYDARQTATGASRMRPCPSSFSSALHKHRSSAVSDEEQITVTATLVAAQRRITDLERELQRTTQRVDQLTDVVQRQKDELETTRDRHALEMEETRHTYNAVMQRKDEVQEEALRQLLKSRQLLASAAKFNAVVAAKKFEAQQLAKENNTSTAIEKRGVAHPAGARASYNAYEHGARNGSALTQTPVNARHTSVPDHGAMSATKYRGGLKRERQHDGGKFEDDTDVTAGLGDDDAAHLGSIDPSHLLIKRTASEGWGVKGGADPDLLGRKGASVTIKETSPAYIATPTAVGKTSTALVEAPTQSRSARKRRTPRTPSMTNADRLTMSSAGNSARSQRRLPGTTSLKIESPTPVVSTAWTTGRSLTSSCTPPPPPPPPPPPSSGVAVHTVSEAVGRHHRLQQQQQKTQQLIPARPPLAQRAAGRLPPHPLGTAAVPNILSGPSSVASGGPTRSPSPVNPKRGAPLPRRFIFTGLKDDEPQRLSNAIVAVGGDAVALASDLDEPPPHSTTHIVLRGTPRSVKALCGVVSGKWLVSPEYVYNSQESGFWLDELEEGGLRVFPPPLRCQRFLLTVEHPSIRAKLAQVIEYGGGEVLPSGSDRRGAGTGNTVAQDVVVITSGDDLLRYATQDRV